MGILAEIKCSNCDYHQNFPLGGGMRDCDFQTIRESLGTEDAGQLDMLMSQEVQRVTIMRKLGQCQVCRRLQVIPEVTLETDGGKHKKLLNHCQFCGSSRLKTLEPEEVEGTVPCPDCQETLYGRISGFWD